MSNKTKDLYGNKKTPITLSVEEFYEYIKNVKTIYLCIGFFVISFFLFGMTCLFLVALQSLNILNVSDTVIGILIGLCFVLFIVFVVLAFKKIIEKSKLIYLNNIIVIDSDLLKSINKKGKWYKIKFRAMSVATLIFCIIGVVLMVLTEAKYPHTYSSSTGYILLSIITMFLMVSIPLFFSIYSYSDIYIYNYINNNYNL